MVDHNHDGNPRRSGIELAIAGWILCAVVLCQTPVLGQTEVSSGNRLTDDMRAKLVKQGDLTLRDATFVEAMFAIRRVWDVNIVVGNDLKEETVSCEFSETELHEILDTILTPRGYSYRPIGKSLVIVKQESLGAMQPLFESTTIAVMYADPKEIQAAVSFYLSDKGQIQVVDSAKRLVVIDYPERLEQVAAKVQELDLAARDLGSQGEAVLSAAERQAIRRGSAAGALNGNGQPNTPATSMAGSPLPGANHKAAFFDLKHTKAELVMPTLQPLLSPLGKLSVLPKDNRLVAVDSPERLILIAEAIRELDVPRPQVRIAALIYDASLEDIRRLGVSWNKTGFHGRNLNSAGVAQDSAVLDVVNGAIPAAGVANGAFSISSLGSTFDVTAVVQALAQSKKSRLLADPTVTVYDQEEAKIEIVTEIPFQQLTQGANGSNIGTTAFREAGVSLTVTPQIGDDDTITMMINPRFSLLTGFTPGTNQPIIDRRETNTTVRIRNRETLVIGGLKQKSSINGRSGVPGLMNLHWPIGELFKVKDATARDSELVVFITPELLEMNCLGNPREHDIFNSSMPSLNCIPAPQLPDDPCPLEDWKHRCGCKKCKHGGHDGPCKAIQAAELPPPNTIYETPTFPESLPSVPPSLPVEENWNENPAAISAEKLTDPGDHELPRQEAPVPRIPDESAPPVKQEKPRGPGLQPVRVEPVTKKPTIAKPESVAIRPTSPRPSRLPPLPDLVQTPKRLPAIQPEPAYMAERLTPRDIFKPLPPISDLKQR